MRIGVKPGQWGWSFDDLRAAWTTAEASGFDHVSCFDHVSASPAGLAAWDAPTLLAAMAGATERVGLAVEVLNVALRHPFLLAAQVATAQAMSKGRVRAGLGAGSLHLAKFDHEALGIRFPSHDERIERLAACCRVLPALWRGETVDEPSLGLAGASLGPIAIAPPLVLVGGTSDRSLEIAAAYADGWHAPSGLERFPELADRLDEICERVGRTRPIEKGTQVFASEVDPGRAGEIVRGLERARCASVTFVFHEDPNPLAIARLAEELGLREP